MIITYIIPIFNESKTVKRSIIQAIKIPIKKKEIIVIDNGSTDNSNKIIKKFSQHRNVKIILRKKNMGFGATIDQGTKMAKGKYIYIHYGDLEYDIKASLKMLKLAEKNNLDIVFASRLVNKFKKMSVFSIIKKRPHYIASIILTKLANILFKKKLTDIIGTKLYKKSSILKFLPKKINIGYDLELDAIFCQKFFKSEEVSIKYKPRADSKEKKVKWWHMFFFILAILKVKFLK